MIRYYWKLLTGKTNAKNPAKFNLKHIWAIIQSWYRSITAPTHIKEQIAWRIKQVREKSPECWEKGFCVQCGCEMKGKVKADIGCEESPYCYPEMMSKEQWKKFKNQQNVSSND